jgi:hypothetical protein
MFGGEIPYPGSARDSVPHRIRARTADADGTVIGFVAAITDITDRRTVEERLAHTARVQKLFAEIGDIASTSLSVADLMTRVAQRVAAELGATRSGFARIDVATGVIVVEEDFHGADASLAGAYPIDLVGPHLAAERRCRPHDGGGRPRPRDPRSAQSYDTVFAPTACGRW